MKVKKITKRKITEEDVINLNKKEPFKTYRFRSKGVNFGFIFGRSAYGFQPELEENWTDDEIDLYIVENKLELVENQEGQLDPYLTVAKEFRKRFFEKYKKLMPWIRNCHAYATRNGYVECPQGGRRHLPWMKFEGKDGDKKLYSNFKNISVNSPVQGFEAISIYDAMIKIDKAMVKNNMKSMPIAMIHDSLVFYVHKDEIKQLALICKENMEQLTKWPIPIEVEFEFGHTWGFGFEVDFNNIDNSIKNILEEKLK